MLPVSPFSSVRSTKKILTFIVSFFFGGVTVSHKYFVQFWKQKHWWLPLAANSGCVLLAKLNRLFLECSDPVKFVVSNKWYVILFRVTRPIDRCRHGAEQYAGDLECVFCGYHLDRAILKIADAAYCFMPYLDRWGKITGSQAVSFCLPMHHFCEPRF